MVGVSKSSARIVAAIFTVAMIYASFCSNACGLGVCPNQEQQSASHDCDRPPSSHHSSSSHHHGPGNPDCSVHHHPTLNLEKADGLPQFQPTRIGQVVVGDLLSDLLGTDAVSLNASSFSDLGSPPTPKDPLYRRISVLRI
jgi:hypothetical protein